MKKCLKNQWQEGDVVVLEKDYILQGTCLYVRLPEELDHESGELVKQQTDRVMSENPVQSMVFDFQRTMFMDSSGIGMIMSRYRNLGMRKGCVSVMGVNDRIRKILCLSGMHKIVAMDECE